MDRRFFTLVGAVALLAALTLLLAFGVDTIAHDAMNAVVFAAFALGGVCAILAGQGIDVGPVSWRVFGGATYFLLSVAMLEPILAPDAGTYATFPSLASGLVGVLAITLLVAMGVDVVLDSGRLVRVEPRTTADHH